MPYSVEFQSEVAMDIYDSKNINQLRYGTFLLLLHNDRYFDSVNLRQDQGLLATLFGKISHLFLQKG